MTPSSSSTSASCAKSSCVTRWPSAREFLVRCRVKALDGAPASNHNSQRGKWRKPVNGSVLGSTGVRDRSPTRPPADATVLDAGRRCQSTCATRIAGVAPDVSTSERVAAECVERDRSPDHRGGGSSRRRGTFLLLAAIRRLGGSQRITWTLPDDLTDSWTKTGAAPRPGAPSSYVRAVRPGGVDGTAP